MKNAAIRIDRKSIEQRSECIDSFYEFVSLGIKTHKDRGPAP